MTDYTHRVIVIEGIPKSDIAVLDKMPIVDVDFEENKVIVHTKVKVLGKITNGGKENG